MRNKRSLLFMVVGAACALVAAIAMHRYMSGSQRRAPAAEGVRILVATREIGFGELLVLEGHGSNANVAFAAGWPKHLGLEGAIHDDQRIAGQPVRACAAFVKHQPILESQIAAEDTFVPDSMALENIGVKPNDIISGRLRPGMTVDVLRVTEKGVADFMRSVKLYALGDLDLRGRPVKSEGAPKLAWLMIKKSDRRAFRNARAGSDHFVLLESENPDPAGPVLVDSGAAAQIRKDEAQGLLDQARSSAGAGDYERALGLLEDISSDYADVSSVCAAAKREADNCRLKLGEALYEKARDAVERTKDFTAALRWLDMIEKEYARGGKLQEKAEKLRETTLAALDKNRNELRYQTLLTNMGKALDRGDLPQAEKLLADLKALVAEGFEPSEGGGGSQQAEAYYAGRLADAQAKFSIDKKVLESHLKQGNYEQAREKVEEIKERFPEHPEIAELEDLLAAEPAGP